jgi:hypothetical protein
MLIVENTVETWVSPDTIWKRWEDVESWPSWDHGILSSKIYGPFQQGTRGLLKPKGGPAVKTQLLKVQPKECFIDRARLPLAKILVSHFLKNKNGKTLVTHRIEMKGPLSWFFAFVIGRGMKKNLPSEMDAMIKMAEKMEAQSL